jgi:hypothetical protein
MLNNKCKPSADHCKIHDDDKLPEEYPNSGCNNGSPFQREGKFSLSSPIFVIVAIILFSILVNTTYQAANHQISPSRRTPPPPTQVVQISPVRDNTLFEDENGSLSNGAGEYLFVGKTGEGLVRHALIEFDVPGSIPAGSTITNVTLTLHMSRTVSGVQTVSLHRINSSWGEGTSDAPDEEGAGTQAATGDATWLHRFHDTDT